MALALASTPSTAAASSGRHARTEGNALFLGEPPPRALRGWAKNLAQARERTVLEQHTARWRCWFDAFPAGLAVRATVDELWEDVTPEPGETWGTKLRRSRRAVRNAFVRRSEHDREAE